MFYDTQLEGKPYEPKGYTFFDRAKVKAKNWRIKTACDKERAQMRAASNNGEFDEEEKAASDEQIYGEKWLPTKREYNCAQKVIEWLRSDSREECEKYFK